MSFPMPMLLVAPSVTFPFLLLAHWHRPRHLLIVICLVYNTTLSEIHSIIAWFIHQPHIIYITFASAPAAPGFLFSLVFWLCRYRLRGCCRALPNTGTACSKSSTLVTRLSLKAIITNNFWMCILITALPINVAPKNVQNGTRKWPHVIPAKSNRGLGICTENIHEMYVKKMRLLTATTQLKEKIASETCKPLF